MRLIGNIYILCLGIARNLFTLETMRIHLQDIHLALGNKAAIPFIIGQLLPFKGHRSSFFRVYGITQVLFHGFGIGQQLFLLSSQPISPCLPMFIFDIIQRVNACIGVSMIYGLYRAAPQRQHQRHGYDARQLLSIHQLISYHRDLYTNQHYIL